MRDFIKFAQTVGIKGHRLVRDVDLLSWIFRVLALLLSFEVKDSLLEEILVFLIVTIAS